VSNEFLKYMENEDKGTITGLKEKFMKKEGDEKDKK
jgi:hypothetical protein